MSWLFRFNTIQESLNTILGVCATRPRYRTQVAILKLWLLDREGEKGGEKEGEKGGEERKEERKGEREEERMEGEKEGENGGRERGHTCFSPQ